MYDNYSFWDKLGISKEEHVALKGLSANKGLITEKPDKGNSIVLLNRNDYIKRMNEMLSDSSKFKKRDIKPGKMIIFLLQQEDRPTNSLIKVNLSVIGYIGSFIQEAHNLVLCMVYLKSINH